MIKSSALTLLQSISSISDSFLLKTEEDDGTQVHSIRTMSEDNAILLQVKISKEYLDLGETDLGIYSFNNLNRKMSIFGKGVKEYQTEIVDGHSVKIKADEKKLVARLGFSESIKGSFDKDISKIPTAVSTKITFAELDEYILNPIKSLASKKNIISIKKGETKAKFKFITENDEDFAELDFDFEVPAEEDLNINFTENIVKIPKLEEAKFSILAKNKGIMFEADLEIGKLVIILNAAK